MRHAMMQAAVMVALVSGGCMTADVTPSASVTTLMPDAERWFKLNWEVTPTGELRRLSGYVQNTYGEAAGRVQLLGQALDSSGAVVGQRLEWVPFVVPGFGRVYYEIPNMPPADHYRVTVWAYERIQGRDHGPILR